jgi:hypothetical protein
VRPEETPAGAYVVGERRELMYNSAMEFTWSAPPMLAANEVSYRSLYGDRAFWQRELISSDELAAMARQREIPSIGSFMKLDENGAFEPIAFVDGPTPQGRSPNLSSSSR